MESSLIVSSQVFDLSRSTKRSDILAILKQIDDTRQDMTNKHNRVNSSTVQILQTMVLLQQRFEEMYAMQQQSNARQEEMYRMQQEMYIQVQQSQCQTCFSNHVDGQQKVTDEPMGETEGMQVRRQISSPREFFKKEASDVVADVDGAIGRGNKTPRLEIDATPSIAEPPSMTKDEAKRRLAEAKKKLMKGGISQKEFQAMKDMCRRAIEQVTHVTDI